METHHRLPIRAAGREVSHLAVRLARPAGEPRGWVLYLHGFRSSQSGEKAAFFRARMVAAGLAFGSFDFQGHGESGGDLAAGTFTRNLEDVARVQRWLESRGAGPVILVGSSMGGAAALWTAALHPEWAAAVLTLAPAVTQGERLEAWAGPEGLTEWERTGVRRWEDEMGSAELGWEMLEDLRRYPLARLAERLRRPALLLQGRRDASVGWRGAVELVERCTGGPVDLVLFGDGDHRLVDRLERLWELMRGFLAAHGALAAA
jgi:pimeloyl-ACP methyl ester carboxylesterase